MQQLAAAHVRSVLQSAFGRRAPETEKPADIERLGDLAAGRAGLIRGVAVAEFDRRDFRLLASGPAEPIPGEDPAYRLLVGATWDDVPDLRAATVRIDRAWPAGR